MNTRQKIIIALLFIYEVFAIIMLFVVPDYDLKLMICLSILNAIMLISGICLKSDLNSKSVAITEPNGMRPDSLGTIMGIGTRLLGPLFRFREIEGTWASYRFVWFILPLFPSGCYRVKMLDGWGKEWMIYGSEKSDVKELVSVYLIIYGFLFWFFFANFWLMMFLM